MVYRQTLVQNGRILFSDRMWSGILTALIAKVYDNHKGNNPKGAILAQGGHHEKAFTTYLNPRSSPAADWLHGH